jgi:hypothetical protein
MDPVDRAWHWWTHLIEVPLWDPWLAAAVPILAFMFIVRGVGRLLQP